MITRERTALLDPREGNFADFDVPYLKDVYGPAIYKLTEDFSKEWYRKTEPSAQNPSETFQQRCKLALCNSFLEVSQQKKQEITPEEALQVVFKEYGKKGFVDEWKKYTFGMSAAQIKAIGLKPPSVGQARRRTRQKNQNLPKTEKQ